MVEGVLDCVVRRCHVVVPHRDKHFEIRVLRERVTQGDACVYIVVICAPVPRTYSPTENVVFKISLVAEFRANVVIEGGCVRRSNCGFTWIVISTVSRET